MDGSSPSTPSRRGTSDSYAYAVDPIGRWDLTGAAESDVTFDIFGFDISLRVVTQVLFTYAVASLAVAGAAAVCGATAGLGCVAIGAIAIAMPIMVPGQFLIDGAFGHKTEPLEAVSYLVDPVTRGTSGAVMRALREGIVDGARIRVGLAPKPPKVSKVFWGHLMGRK